MAAPQQQRVASSGSFWKHRQVLVTGATGLLGGHLTRRLVEGGAQVVALVRDGVPKSLVLGSDPEWNLERKMTVVRGELEDFAVLERTLNEYEIDSVFHLGAQTIVGAANRSPLPTFKSNIEGTWNLLEACRLHSQKIQRVIVASSDKAYGNLQGESYDESSPLKGEHPYDVSKSCADLIARAYFVSYGLPVAITRCGNFFGPGDLNFNRLVPGTIRSVLAGESPVIRSDGKYVRDYIYADDGALAYLKLAEAMVDRRFSGEAFNFSYGLRLSVAEVVRKVIEVTGKSGISETILNQASNEIPVQCLNSEKAQKLLGWKPQYGFDDGLKATVDWYRKHLAE